MSIEFILHGATDNASGMSLLFGVPIAAGITAVAVAALAVWLGGWRAGIAAAAMGVALMAGGLIGDVVSHNQQGHDRHALLDSLMDRPTAATAHQLMELEEAETRNVWHFVTAAGQGLLIAGLAGAAFMLWHGGRNPIASEESTPVPLRRVA